MLNFASTFFLVAHILCIVGTTSPNSSFLIVKAKKAHQSGYALVRKNIELIAREISYKALLAKTANGCYQTVY